MSALAHVSSGRLPNLKTLVLTGCAKLRVLPENVAKLGELDIAVDGCIKLQTISIREHIDAKKRALGPHHKDVAVAYDRLAALLREQVGATSTVTLICCACTVACTKLSPGHRADLAIASTGVRAPATSSLDLPCRRKRRKRRRSQLKPKKCAGRTSLPR